MSDNIPHQERYSTLIQWSDEDEAYIVTVPELPYCRTHGATYEEAVQQGQDAIDSWVWAVSESGHAVPAPRLFDHEKSSRCWNDTPVEGTARTPVAAAGA